jgi:membrane fusion protein, macrolide-specific efflux system
VLTVIAVVAVAWGGYRAWRHFVPAAAPDLNIYAAVERGDIEDLVAATGALQPRDYVDVGAQVNGQLTRILVEVGQQVGPDDLLAEIDATQTTARVEANRAQIRSQEAQLVDRQATLAKAERDYTRQQELMARQLTTVEAVQNAQTAVESARAQIGTLKAQIEQARASMRVEETNLRFTKIFAPMRGTVVSIAAKRGQTINTNQLAPTILRIADLSTMVVQTQVSEADVGRLRTGMDAYFTTLGGQGRRWYGTLSKVEPTPTVTNNVVLYNALFEVPNDNQSLLPQMTAQVFFVVAQARDVLVVPMSAVTLQRRPPGGAAPKPPGAAPDAPAAPPMPGSAPMPPPAAAAAAAAGAGPGGPRPGGAGAGFSGRRGPGGPGGPGGPPGPQRGPRTGTVQVQAADGTLETREVTIGVTNRVHAEVLSGLAEGERVVAGTRQEDGPRAGQQAGGQRPNIGGFGGAPGGGFGPPGGFPGGR